MPQRRETKKAALAGGSKSEEPGLKMSDKVGIEIEHVNASIRRWQTRLTRAVNAINRLTAKRTRLERKRLSPAVAQMERTDDYTAQALKAAVARPVRANAATVLAAEANAAIPQGAAGVHPPCAGERDRTGASQDDRLDIPTFLRRAGSVGGMTAADAEAVKAIEAEQAEHAKRKKQGQDARRKAQRRGELRKMPLQGKAALAAIRGE